MYSVASISCGLEKAFQNRFIGFIAISYPTSRSSEIATVFLGRFVSTVRGIPNTDQNMLRFFYFECSFVFLRNRLVK